MSSASLAFTALLFGLVLLRFPSTGAQWTNEFNGHEYRFFLAYADASLAKAICEQNQGYLATIGSEEENDFVYNVVRAGGQTAWLGLYREGGPLPNCSNPCSEGWEWIDGSSYNFTKWQPGEPSSSAHNSAFMTPDQPFWWGDPIERSRAFVCERESQCTMWPDTFEGHQYKLFYDMIGPDDAQDICIAHGGHLATVHSSEENKFVASLASRLPHGVPAWLGLFREGGLPPGCDLPCREGFEWVDGSPVDFTNWTPNEPSSWDDYALFIRWDTDVWFASPQRFTRAFICEIDVQCAPWTDVFEDHEYHLFMTDARPKFAQQVCEEHGGYLATAHSEEENDFIASLAISTTAWFGLHRDGGDPPGCRFPCQDGWNWVDGSQVNYTKWQDNEPSGADDYAAFMGYNMTSWFADPLCSSRPFICERERCERCFNSCSRTCSCTNN